MTLVRQCRSQRETGASAADIPSVSPVHNLGVRSGFPLELPGDCAVSDHEDLAQEAAGDRELGGALGQGDKEEGPEEEMKPRKPRVSA